MIESEALEAVCESQEGLDLALSRVREMGRKLVQMGARIKVVGVRHRDNLTIRQRKFLHGVVIKQIAERYRANGRHSIEAWKRYFKDEFVGSEFVELVNPVTGEITIEERRISSETLDVYQYSTFIEQVIAYAQVDLGLALSIDGAELSSVLRERSEWQPNPLPGPKVQSEAYRRLVASLPCICCGVEGYSQCAHANAPAAGKGKGTKADDRQTFPLCGPSFGRRGCHEAFDQGALFPKGRRRDVELQWADDTRRRIREMADAPEALRLMASA